MLLMNILKISSKKNFIKYIIRITLILSIGFLLMFFYYGFSWLLLLLFIFIEIVIISQRFTSMISIKENEVQIDYYKWLSRNQIILNLADIDFRIKKTAEFSSGPFHLLQILNGAKLIYQIDSRDGFELIDFNSIVSLKTTIKQSN